MWRSATQKTLCVFGGCPSGLAFARIRGQYVPAWNSACWAGGLPYRDGLQFRLCPSSPKPLRLRTPLRSTGLSAAECSPAGRSNPAGCVSSPGCRTDTIAAGCGHANGPDYGHWRIFPDHARGRRRASRGNDALSTHLRPVCRNWHGHPGRLRGSGADAALSARNVGSATSSRSFPQVNECRQPSQNRFRNSVNG